MAMVTVLIRLSEEDYRRYRLKALEMKISFAELVRRALKEAYGKPESTRK